MLREGLSPLALNEILVRSFGGITLAEVGLAWVFVTLFTTAGWWAPMALAVAVLLAWPREGVEFMDPLTKLRATGCSGASWTACWPARDAPGARGLLVLFDLDGFGLLNKEHGQHVGDEVLAEIGHRTRAEIRSTDFAGLVVARFAMFYAGVVEVRTARQIARRLERRSGGPSPRPPGPCRWASRSGRSSSSRIPRSVRLTLMEWADKVSRT